MEDDIQRSEKMSSVFLELGCQYYAIARYYAAIPFTPICATMFHHAIEMLIKGYLVRFLSSKELKSKVGHSLQKSWAIFRSRAEDESLACFDTSIINLDKVELLRYPDEMVDNGFRLNVGHSTPEPSQNTDSDNTSQYFVNISDLDDIVSSIFDVCKVNPKAAFRNTPAEFMKTLPLNLRPWE
jgi:hypothetical protein